MCKNNVFASTFIGLRRQWHRLYNILFTLWGLHVLLSALQMPARTSAFPIKEYVHTLCCQQLHSLHLRMTLDPHNRQHLPKLGKHFPHCPCLNFCSLYFILYQMHVMKELFVWVIWSCDVKTWLGWVWHFLHLCWQPWPWYIKILESLGWIFHEKLAYYRPCSQISRNELVISQITGLLLFTDQEKYILSFMIHGNQK